MYHWPGSAELLGASVNVSKPATTLGTYTLALQCGYTKKEKKSAKDRQASHQAADIQQTLEPGATPTTASGPALPLLTSAPLAGSANPVLAEMTKDVSCWQGKHRPGPYCQHFRYSPYLS